VFVYFPFPLLYQISEFEGDDFSTIHNFHWEVFLIAVHEHGNFLFSLHPKLNKTANLKKRKRFSELNT